MLAAAIVGRCDVIVTCNLCHFPASLLSPLDIAAVHPDTVLVERRAADLGAFLSCVKRLRERLKNLPTCVVGRRAARESRLPALRLTPARSQPP